MCEHSGRPVNSLAQQHPSDAANDVLSCPPRSTTTTRKCSHHPRESPSSHPMPMHISTPKLGLPLTFSRSLTEKNIPRLLTRLPAPGRISTHRLQQSRFSAVCLRPRRPAWPPNHPFMSQKRAAAMVSLLYQPRLQVLSPIRRTRNDCSLK